MKVPPAEKSIRIPAQALQTEHFHSVEINHDIALTGTDAHDENSESGENQARFLEEFLCYQRVFTDSGLLKTPIQKAT